LADFIAGRAENRAAMKPVLGGNGHPKLVPGVKALKGCTTVQGNTEPSGWRTIILYIIQTS